MYESKDITIPDSKERNTVIPVSTIIREFKTTNDIWGS